MSLHVGTSESYVFRSWTRCSANHIWIRLAEKIDESMTNEHQRASRSTDSASAVGVMPVEKTRFEKEVVSRRRLTMPRSAATAGYNVAFFRITHIAVHCIGGPLFLASSCASAVRIREWHKVREKERETPRDRICERDLVSHSRTSSDKRVTSDLFAKNVFEHSHIFARKKEHIVWSLLQQK